MRGMQPGCLGRVKGWDGMMGWGSGEMPSEGAKVFIRMRARGLRRLIMLFLYPYITYMTYLYYIYYILSKILTDTDLHMLDLVREPRRRRVFMLRASMEARMADGSNYLGDAGWDEWS